MASPTVELIPWDYNSQGHLDRLYEQRVACGWRSDEIDLWKKMSIEGVKNMFWVVLPDDLPGREDLIAKHIAQYPKESAPLKDTAKVGDGPPSQRSFFPVGHVATDFRPALDRELGLVSEPDEKKGDADAAIIWVATLYVSWAVQGSGLGNASMRAIEKAAGALAGGRGGGSQKDGGRRREVICALDAVQASFQSDATVVEMLYRAQGNPAPKVLNELWYKRQGYVEFLRQTAGYQWTNPATGAVENIPVVYLKKTLS